MLISVSDYMKQTTKYNRDRQAPATLLDKNHYRLTEEVQAGVIVQRLNVAIQRLGADGRPVFFDVELWSRVHSRDMQDSYRVTNAIWNCPLFQSLGLQRDRDTYKRLQSAFGNSNHCQRGLIRNPIHLAQGLRPMNIDLGIIFLDEPDVVCWPLGRDNGDRFVINYKDSTHYSAVRLLFPGERLPQRTTVDVPVSKKPFPFLRPPSELRNAVYEFYLKVSGQTTSGALDLSAELPPLCNTNRQLHREVSPIFLASRIFNVRTDVGKTSKYSLNRMVVGRSRWLGCTKNGALFRRINFSSHSATENYGLLELSAADSRNGRGFHVKSGEGDFFLDAPRNHWPCFQEMLDILVQDSVNGFFTLGDIAALADFFCELQHKASGD